MELLRSAAQVAEEAAKCQGGLMQGDEPLVWLFVGAAVVAIIVADRLVAAQKDGKPLPSLSSFIGVASVKPGNWLKAKAIANAARQLAENIAAKRATEAQTLMTQALLQEWRGWPRVCIDDQPLATLDMMIIGFQNSFAAESIRLARMGAIPLLPNEVLTCIHAAVLLSKTHTHQELEAAVQRILERADQSA
jgi:hypothetical protein